MATEAFDLELKEDLATALAPLLEKYPQLLGMAVINSWRPEYAPNLVRGLILLQKDQLHNLDTFIKVQGDIGIYRDNYITGFLRAAVGSKPPEEKNDRQPEGPPETPGD